MEFRRNLTVSFVLHTAVLVAASTLVAGRDVAIRIPSAPLYVGLVEEPALSAQIKPARSIDRNVSPPQKSSVGPAAVLRASNKTEPKVTANETVAEQLNKAGTASEMKQITGEMSIDLGHSTVSSGNTSAQVGNVQQISIHQVIGNISASQEQRHSSGTSGNTSLKKSIRDALQRNLVYPYIARKRKMEGTVLVDFRINQKGMAEDVKVLKGSGYAILDSAARDTVIKASPFPVANYSIEVPITYRLTEER